jgi:hypothetical protein
MVFSLIVISTIFLSGSAIFLIFVADAYMHIPAPVRIKARPEILQRNQKR